MFSRRSAGLRFLRHFLRQENPSSSSSSYDYLFEPKTTHYTDGYNRHLQQVRLSRELKPYVDTFAFVAPNATLIGNVELFTDSSVWYNSVVKADVKLIRIGFHTAIMDKVIISESLDPNYKDSLDSTFIGSFTTIGERSILRACTIKGKSYIGPGCKILEGAIVEELCILEPGTVVERGQFIPKRQVWGGNPARFVRDLHEEETQRIYQMSVMNIELASLHLRNYRVPSTLYKQLEEFHIPVGWTSKQFFNQP